MIRNGEPPARLAAQIAMYSKTTSLAEHADDDHRAQQQKDYVPVDSGLVGVEHVLGVDDPERQYHRRAAERDHDLWMRSVAIKRVGDDENG